MVENGHPKSLRQLAYERIKQKIVSLELAPGSVIDEAGLQAEFVTHSLNSGTKSNWRETTRYGCLIPATWPRSLP